MSLIKSLSFKTKQKSHFHRSLYIEIQYGSNRHVNRHANFNY